MRTLRKAMHNLNRNLAEKDRRPPIPFEEFIKILVANPRRVARNVFQVFHDMVSTYVGEGYDEYPDDPESIHYVYYDCSKLFVENVDHPFFADRLFANRLIKLVEAMRIGAQQNKIYIFEGPPGSGKSTLLNNLLLKFEEYANTEEGMRYETVWRLSKKSMGELRTDSGHLLVEKLMRLLEEKGETEQKQPAVIEHLEDGDDYIEIPCPSHDNPILMIPKFYRRQFFDDIFANDKFKWKFFTEKEYEWVFHDVPCTICSSIYQALVNKLKSPLRAFGRVYARPYHFNRRLGEGISVFNPGDQPVQRTILGNKILQRNINLFFRDSNLVHYVFSRHAKTNNGIYALMDIKSHNTERLIELHNIISEGVHKVEDIEETVNCLLFALMNPEDKKNIEDIQSFSDRIEYIKVPYVLDINTEVQIYRNIFGRHIDDNFLPTVLHNFSRVIIASRLKSPSEAMQEWIPDPDKYSLYCDKDLFLLKMEIYTGFIPPWLDEDDRRRFTAKRRRRIIGESEKEGWQGFSGRDSIKIFNEFFSTYAKEDQLINMSMLVKFFEKYTRDKEDIIPEGFLEALVNMYDYKILQEVKESLYYYNEEQIAREIKNYMFAVNFEKGEEATCNFTGEKLKITEEFLSTIEERLISARSDRQDFRNDVQREYTRNTLTQEIMRDGKDVTETKLYQSLYSRYVHNLKKKVLNPFLKNENFRRAIKDYNKEDFKTYDKKIKNDVTYLMNNLCSKYGYTQLGAQEVCIYVIDNQLAGKFSDDP